MILQVLVSDISFYWWFCIFCDYYDFFVFCWKIDLSERFLVEDIFEKLCKFGKDCKEGN